MAEIKVKNTTIKKKNATRPRKTLYLRRTVINGKTLNLKKAAARKKLVVKR